MLMTTVADATNTTNAAKAKSVYVDAKVDIGVYTGSNLFSLNTNIFFTMSA